MKVEILILSIIRDVDGLVVSINRCNTTVKRVKKEFCMPEAYVKKGT